MTIKKICGNCSHAMDAGQESLVYCIAHPPVPVQTHQGVISHFPMLMTWAKCDEFKQGKVQKKSEEQA